MELKPIIKRNLSNDVKGFLYEYIRHLSPANGAKLPREEQLAKDLSVSRVTVRRALDDLEQEGLILRLHGKGTFVNAEAVQIKVNLSQGQEFSDMIEASGYRARVGLVRAERREAGAELSAVFQIPESAPVMEVEKVFFADDHPAIVCIDRCPLALLTQPVADGEWAQSTFELLRKYAGKIVTRDKLEVLTMTRGQMQAQFRGASGMECDSVLVLNAINYDQDNQPVIYDTEFYNTDYIRYNLIRNKNVYRYE